MPQVKFFKIGTNCDLVYVLFQLMLYLRNAWKKLYYIQNKHDTWFELDLDKIIRPLVWIDMNVNYNITS